MYIRHFMFCSGELTGIHLEAGGINVHVPMVIILDYQFKWILFVQYPSFNLQNLRFNTYKKSYDYLDNRIYFSTSASAMFTLNRQCNGKVLNQPIWI